MKKVLSIATVLIAFVAVTAFTVAAIGEFKFEKETHDFGEIPKSQAASFEFKFTNVGDAPIILSDVAPSCGCSVADYSKTPVKPGETGSIKVTFNASTATGPFTKSFTVKSNSKTPVKILTIKGVVK
ncbi:DUF1573 domain-containing protein [Parapedobacter sp. SGR-10]|uniref:DUF1573 domain-containing protein n=1 Tax=Parapedobacter sp. SGR-10 TaxID=2710879 RepID=UPI0013D8A92D|nr:DUF1573 domain-containing protein [Parapedobacter sp. SGR-10]NGF57321.1 DUF1573 domain-containing protein [Parapedobacter sp. SGR-10]